MTTMTFKRLNNSSTVARYRVSFTDLTELETTGSPEVADRIEPHNYGSRLVQHHEDGFTIDIFTN